MSFQNLLEDAKKMRHQGLKLDAIRARLTSSGWDVNTIDRALWQIGMRDRKNVYFVQRMKKVLVVLGVVVGLAGIVYTTLHWESRQKKEQESVAEVAGASAEASEDLGSDALAAASEPTVTEPVAVSGGEVIRSDDAGFGFEYPDDWVLTQVPPTAQDSSSQWQLEHIENLPIKKTLEEKYNLVTEEGETSTTGQLALLNDPLAQQLATINFIVSKPPTHDIESSLEGWRSELESANGQLGIYTSDFNEISVDGVEGYTYIVQIELGQINITTREYIFLVPDERRIEISAYPIASKHTEAIESILKTIQIF